MSFQQTKPKKRITKSTKIEADYQQFKDMSMAYKSPLRRLNSRNRVSTEPKIMLKKIRSIKLHKIYSLKRRETSQLDWMSADSSTNDSTSNQSVQDNHTKATSFSDGKKDFQVECESDGDSHCSSSGGSTTTAPSSQNQNGSMNAGKERKKMSKPKQHTCPSCFRPFNGDATLRLDDPLQKSLMEVSDASPDHVKLDKKSAGTKTQVQVDSHASDSSIFSTESSEHNTIGSHFSPSNSAGSLEKSFQTLTKSSSTRTGKKLRNKISFKRSSVEKTSKSTNDTSLNRATCSSTLKDSKFPKQDELDPGQIESEIGLTKKVCPYRHCSLHGHSHAPEPPPKRFSYIRRRSQKTQKSTKPKDLSAVAVTTSSGDKKKPMKTVSSIQPALGKANGGTESSHEKDHKTSGFVARTVTKPRAESYTGPSQGKEIYLKDEPSILTQVANAKDSGEATKDSSGVALTSYTLEKVGASGEEKKDISHQEAELINRSIPLRDSETNEDNNGSSVNHEASEVYIRKNNHISMWHMIHQHMVLGLAEDAENQQHHSRFGEGQAKDLKTSHKTNVSDLSLDISNTEMGVENHTPESRALKARKLFAIKLVREAIEKILLPEVEDQTSDVISIRSEPVSDEEPSEKNHDGGENQSIATYKESISQDYGGKNNNELRDDKSFNVEKVTHGEVTISVPEEKKARKESEKKTLKGWSNLKKIILLKRFVTELEKVKKFNPVQPRILALESESEAEKVSLRHQTMGEKRSSEEWMLDYALRQVVSELAPTQKRKVALLVKAFETVVPPQEDQHVQGTTPKVRAHTDLKEEEIQGILSLSSDLQSRGPEFSGTELDNSSTEARKPSFLPYSSETETNKEDNEAEIVIPTSGAVSIKKLTSSKEMTGEESSPEHEFVQEFPPPIASNPASMANREHKTELDKQNIKMWHMIYQHVVSGIAEKVGTQLLDVDGEDEEQDNANKFPDGNSSGSFHDNMKRDPEEGKENHDTNHQKIEFNRSTAVKLVQEAVDEILLPDIQDDPSDSQSTASDVLPDQELENKHHGDDDEPSILNSTESAEDNFKDGVRNIGEGGVSLDQQKKVSPVADINSQDYERAASLVKSSLFQQKSKNWSKLKKLIRLKRSIKALESARKPNPKPPQQLPLTCDPEEEKIKLRQQMMNERKKAEQWMLDYAVQHIVTKLTPARKRRVAMLVEAFEAVVPLPEA